MTELTEVSGALQRATVLCDLGRYDQAIVLLRAVLARDPQNVTGLCLLARAHLGQGSASDALRVATDAISLAPEHEWPHRIASLALSSLGRDEEALATARTAVRLGPHTAQCYINLAQILAASGLDLIEARDVAARAVALAPHDPDSYLAVSAVAIADSRHDDAMSAVHRALALDPDNSAAHNELARIQLRRHRAGNAVALARAASGFATAVRNDPRSTVSRQNLDLVMHVFLARTAYGIFLIAWIASRFRGNAEPAALRVIPALLLVVPIGYAYRFIADLTPHPRAYLRRAIRHPVIGSAVACDALAASGLIVSAGLPRATPVALGCAAAFAILARLLLWLHGRREFRTMRRQRKYRIRTGLLWFIGLTLFVVSLAILLPLSNSSDVTARQAVPGIGAAAGCIAIMWVIYRRRR
jgi:Flp pilus assembly protein TadD